MRPGAAGLALLALATCGAAERPSDGTATTAADQSVAVAASLRSTEEALDEATRRGEALAAELARSRAALATEAATLTTLLPMLERLARYPAETVLAAPGQSGDRLRGLLILRGVTDGVHARALAAAAAQARIATTEAALASEQAALREAVARQREQGTALDLLTAAAAEQARAAQGVAEAAMARRASAAVARAPTLREAVAAIPLPRPAPPSAPPLATAPQRATAAANAPSAAAGTWVSPAAGGVVRRFGSVGEAGEATGATLRTPPGSRVVAPCAGRVAFAQPFRSYGPLAIVDCGGATHVVLGGLDRLDVRAGQAVHAGQPVGVMPPGGSGALYVELRRGGDAVDPTPVLRGAKGARDGI